jgi:hypothetical protein
VGVYAGKNVEGDLGLDLGLEQGSGSDAVLRRKKFQIKNNHSTQWLEKKKNWEQ